MAGRHTTSVRPTQAPPRRRVSTRTPSSQVLKPKSWINPQALKRGRAPKRRSMTASRELDKMRSGMLGRKYMMFICRRRRTGGITSGAQLQSVTARGRYSAGQASQPSGRAGYAAGGRAGPELGRGDGGAAGWGGGGHDPPADSSGCHVWADSQLGLRARWAPLSLVRTAAEVQLYNQDALGYRAKPRLDRSQSSHSQSPEAVWSRTSRSTEGPYRLR